MLIKRTERQARRGTLAAALANQIGGGLDRRTFLRRSGLAAGGLAASARCRSPACARPRPAGRRPPARRSRCARTSARIARSAAPSSPKWRTACGSARSRAGIRPINRGSHCAKGAATRELVHGDRRLRYPMKLVERPVDAHLLGRRDQRDRRQADGDPREVGRRIRSTGSARPSSPTKAPISTASSRRSGAPTTPTTRRASAIRPPSPASPIPGATAR